MTIPLAGDDSRVLHAATLGEAWLAVAERILADGTPSSPGPTPATSRA